MITFLSQPNKIEPSYSNLVFQFSSTAATDTSLYKYRYVVNIYTPEGLISTQKITPSSEGWGQIDLSPILRNYTHSKPVNMGCTGSTPIHEAKWGYLEDNMIVYSISVGEEYATTPNGIVVDYDGKGNVGAPAVNSEVCYTYNGVKEWFNGKNYDFTPYYLTGSTTFNSGVCRYMTNSPRTRWVRESDYYTLAAFNWAKQNENIGSRGVYSALFTFYDANNNILSTGRTYNIAEDCGTRPNCSYYDRYWVDSNWYEKQVVYLGAGVPNIEEHGISYPSGTNFYKVELEATLNNPNPGTPQFDEFEGCSCHSYSGTALVDDTEVEYYDCQGVLQQLTFSEGQTFNVCACQNTIGYALGSGSTIVDLGECDACVCRTYSISNSDPDFSYTYTGRTCSGYTIFSGTIEADTTIQVCACEGTLAGTGGISITDIGTCPLPFTADCQVFDVSLNVGYVVEITYTGCCGTLLSFSAAPSTTYSILANNPFPTSILWSSTPVAIPLDPPDCPEPLPPPSPTTFGNDTNIICRSVCDGSTWYFRYTGDTIEVGQYINYYDVPMEIIGVGGGGFISLNRPFVYDTEEQILAGFPCPIITTGSCYTTTIISEPFYFYVDGNCSPGNRQVWFMGKMGTWETYNFRAREDVGYGVNKAEYQSVPELYSTGWDKSSYNGWNAKRNVWNNQVNKSGVLYTDYMPQSELIWLSQELFQSPSVYLVGDNGVLEPITITNTEVIEPNYQINSTLYQVNIEYRSGYNTIRQNHE